MRLSIKRSAEVAWGWSFGGLPDWFVRPGAGSSVDREIALEKLNDPLPSISSGDVVGVILGEGFSLQKQLTFPKAVGSKLQQAIDAQLRRLLPDSGKGFVWRHRITREVDGQIGVEVRLAKVAHLRELEAKVRRTGGKLRTVSFAALPTADPLLDYSTEQDRWVRRWGYLTLLIWVLGASTFYWQSNQQAQSHQNQLAALTKRNTDLALTAVDMRAKLEQHATESSSIIDDMQLLTAETGRLAILLELTEVLDDQTWISELILSSAEVRISGFTETEVTDLLAKIQGLDWVKRVDLDGPIQFDSFSRKNRIDLLISLSNDERER